MFNKIEKENLRTYSSKAAQELYLHKWTIRKTEKFIFDNYFKKPGKLLDVGCGAGRTSRYFHRMGHKVTGIDISKPLIKIAKNKFKDIDFKIMNACQLAFPNNYFDYAVFSFNGLDLIHPYEKRLQALREIHRVLKKGGIFVYSSHNFLPMNLPNILTSKNTLKSHWYNFKTGRLFAKYKIGFSKIGKVIRFGDFPIRQTRTLNSIGFHTVEIRGRDYKNKILINLLDPEPHYVAIKE